MLWSLKCYADVLAKVVDVVLVSDLRLLMKVYYQNDV